MAAHMYSASLAVACCCLILGVFAEWNTNDYLRREHTLVKPYQGSGSSMSLWDFVGSTLVTNNYVRLTPDHQSRQGAIWNTQACNTRNWELHVQFAVHGSGTTLFGDGLAIWYAKEKNRLGDVFGNANFFSGLAIFLDTYSNHNGPHNHEHPYISAMVNNGSMSYDHDRDGTHTQLAGCEAKFRNKDHSTYLAIRYHDNVLKVSMDIDNKNGWKECFEVRGIKLPLGYYFGASAATGQLADNHDIISMKLYELDAPEGQLDYWGLPSAEVFDAPRDRVEDVRSSMSGWKIFLIIILAIIGLGVCGVVGYVIFNKNNDYTRKRFY